MQMQGWCRRHPRFGSVPGQVCHVRRWSAWPPPIGGDGVQGELGKPGHSSAVGLQFVFTVNHPLILFVNCAVTCTVTPTSKVQNVFIPSQASGLGGISTLEEGRLVSLWSYL